MSNPVADSLDSTAILVDRPTAARMLSISTRTLDSLTKAGSIPHTRLGSRVLYSPDVLRDWIKSQSNGGQP